MGNCIYSNAVLDDLSRQFLDCYVLDKEYNISEFSSLFCFINKTIEFVSGLTCSLDKNDDNLSINNNDNYFFKIL